MTELSEVKELFSKTEKSVHDLRQKVEDLEGKSADVLDKAAIEKMQDDLATKMADQQKALDDRIAAIETAANRPGTGGGGAEDDDYTKSFDGYLRQTVDGAELKAMATNNFADGGALVPPVMASGIQARQRRSSPVRALANVVSFEGSSYDILVERGDTGFQWGGEKAAVAETGTPTIHKISVPLHELSALPKVTQRMIDMASFEIQPFLTDKIGDVFGRAEAAAFISGDGVDQPKGFLSYPSDENTDDTRAAGTFQFRKTGAAGDFAATNPGDVLVHLFYDLQTAYQNNATWLMKNTTAAKVATLKDGRGAYLLNSMLNSEGATVHTIQGRPMRLGDHMPAMAGNSLSIAVGDFRSGYTIVESNSFRVLVDPLTAKPFVLFYAKKYVGGGASDFDAIKFLKFAA